MPTSHKRPERYRLYVDESGDHTFKNVHEEQHRYLALLGVWLNQEESYKTFAKSLEQFKEDLFGYRPDSPVCLHRRDIMDRKGEFGILRDPQTRERFDDGLLEVVGEANFTMCCVVIDKREHEAKAYRDLYHPYHYCLAAMLERYVGWLNYFGCVGDVMAESRGGTEDRELRKTFSRFYDDGTRFCSPKNAQKALTSHKLKLKKKEHNIAGLQLADILVTPALHEMVAEAKFEEPVRETYSARLLDAARSKFNQHAYNNRVKGYGKVLLK